MTSVFCIIAISFSFAIILLGAVSSFLQVKKKKAFNKRKILTPLNAFTLCFFVATMLVFYPIFYFNTFASDMNIVKIFKALLLSIYTPLQVFFLNGDFGLVSEFAGLLDKPLSTVYSTYMSIIYTVAPVLVAGYILSFFKESASLIKYSFYKNSDIYIFSEMNERSIALAQDIVSNKQRRQVLVFADVIEQDNQDVELIEQAKMLGAICFKKDILDIGIKFTRKNFVRKLYFIGNNEDENLSQALTLINRKRGSKLDTDKLQLYVFSNSANSEALLNSIDNGNIKVRRINENRNMAFQLIREQPIFQNVKPEDKKINIAIVGLGGYGEEILKAVCWCGQLPGYSLTVHVFEKDNGQEKIKFSAPELVKNNNKNIPGDAQYNIVFHDGIDIRSSHFIDEISKIKDITTVCVSLGDDELNIETSMRIRVALKRFQSDMPPIYAVVYSTSKTETVAGTGLKNTYDQSYGVTFIGSLENRYSLLGIEQPEIEEEALARHLAWAHTEDDRMEEIEKFNHYEYFRRSSMAQALYRKIRTDLGFVKMDESTPEGMVNNNILREYEHRRWNTYMRAEGYVLSDKKDHIAKTHPMLIPFGELTEAEKKKDDF